MTSYAFYRNSETKRVVGVRAEDKEELLAWRQALGLTYYTWQLYIVGHFNSNAEFLAKVVELNKYSMI